MSDMSGTTTRFVFRTEYVLCALTDTWVARRIGLKDYMLLIEFVTGVSVTGHNIDELREHTAQALLAQHPELDEILPPPVGSSKFALNLWRRSIEQQHGETMVVTTNQPINPESYFGIMYRHRPDLHEIQSQ